jgi:hypothetical protein
VQVKPPFRPEVAQYSYKWRLNWDEFKDIALNAEENWIKIKDCLTVFISG